MNTFWDIKNVEAFNLKHINILDKALSTDKNILLSGEDLSTFSLEEHSRLKKYLLKSQRDLEVIACVRSPYSFHCAATQERIKNGRPINFSADFMSQRKKFINLLSFYGDSIKLIPFHESCQHKHGPVGKILEICGIHPETITIHKSNESASNIYTRLQNLFNHQQPRIIRGRLNRSFIRVGSIPGTKFFLTQREYAHFKKKLVYENHFIESTVGLGDSFLDSEINTISHQIDATINFKIVLLLIIRGLIRCNTPCRNSRTIDLFETEQTITAIEPNLYESLKISSPNIIERLICIGSRFKVIPDNLVEILSLCGMSSREIKNYVSAAQLLETTSFS